MLRRIILGIVTLAAMALAQQTVAPTPESVGGIRGGDTDGYNIVQSFELGHRFRTAGGNLGKYRSDVNYGNGIRLLGSNLTIHSREGRGRLFDEIVLTTQGLGNDPYQFSSLRIQKNAIFRYDMLWRLTGYFNPGLTISNGQHAFDTQRRLQDHELTLLPQSSVRLFLGYTRNSQDGPALATTQLFDSLGDEFPLFADIRRVYNEYRLGGEFRLLGIKVNWLRGWHDFKDDTPIVLQQPGAGNNPDDGTTLSRLRREEPYHGTSPYWRVNLFTENDRVAFNGRFSHTMSRRSFIFDETAFGTGRFGAEQNRQILVFGDGRRPVTTAHVTLSLFPVERLAISNHTAFHNTRMEGDSMFRQVSNGASSQTLLFFQFLGIRAVTNTTDLNYRAAKWLGLYGGYHYSTRRTRSIEQFEFSGTRERLPGEQHNTVNSGLAGIRLQPAAPLTVDLGAEIGRADRPFFPIAERNYHALNARVQYRKRPLMLAAAARTNYNTNSVSLSSHSSRSRNFSFDASWAPRGWFAFDAGYSKLHLDTMSGIAFFAARQFIEGDRSIYISNIHAGNLGARFGIRNRADLYFGYSHVEDAGDGRSTPVGGASGARFPAFLEAQTFPLSFRSPLARLSLRLHNKLRLNFGYQYYGYREDFSARQGYRAHTGYSSLLWSFY